MENIQMVDLVGQFRSIENEIRDSMNQVLESGKFINGPSVQEFCQNLSEYLNVNHVIPCANGTDALQIAYMALGLRPGDEIIIPSFNYVSAAEAASLLGLVPRFVDVDPLTFNIQAEDISNEINSNTRAIVAVHLFGLGAEMEGLKVICQEHNLHLIEDTAQSLGADFTSSDGSKAKYGTIGDIGITSFFPSKNLGCFGDGGAIFTNNPELASLCESIASHGQEQKYLYSRVGCNSRLDTLQAAVLNVKLKHYDSFVDRRRKAADYYDEQLNNIPGLNLPQATVFSSHVFNQYTLQLNSRDRDQLSRFLKNRGIPSVVYYPKPLHLQQAFKSYYKRALPISEQLTNEVISIPIHTELTNTQLELICDSIKDFFLNER